LRRSISATRAIRNVAASSPGCGINSFQYRQGQSRSRKEFLHFLAIARGSLQEVATLMIIAERRMYLTVEGALGHQGAGGSRLAIVEWLATLAPEATMTTNYQPPTTSHQPPATNH
jgi:hypothetical protein